VECIWFQVSYSVYQFIGGENDSNSNTELSQRHNLYQTVNKKVSNNKPFKALSNQTSWDTNRAGPIQFQNSLWESMYVNTCNITITIIILVSILLLFHRDAVSLRLLLNLWHSNEGPIFRAAVEVTFESCLLSMMITHFFDTPYSSNSNVCTISCLMSL